MMATDISNADDVIDSRSVIERIEELSPDCMIEDEDEREEFRALIDLAQQAEPCADDWKYGVTLIRDSYFQQYAEELAEDIGAIDKNAGWPLTYIDWEAAAEALKIDYTAVDFDGVTYWVR